jgi:CRISPR-associated protein Csm2
VQQLIRKGGKLLVEEAETLGPRLYQSRLTTSQIRNIYGTVKQMEMRGFEANEFVLLKPKLAYAAARADTSGARELKDVLTWAIDEVGDDETKFARFVDFFEAILAYHKAAGGK